MPAYNSREHIFWEAQSHCMYSYITCKCACEETDMRRHIHRNTDTRYTRTYLQRGVYTHTCIHMHAYEIQTCSLMHCNVIAPICASCNTCMHRCINTCNWVHCKTVAPISAPDNIHTYMHTYTHTHTHTCSLMHCNTIAPICAPQAAPTYILLRVPTGKMK